MNRIKIILQEQGRTQTWLASKLGKSYGSVTNYCNNHRKVSVRLLGRVAKLLNVPVSELLSEPIPLPKTSPQSEKPIGKKRKQNLRNTSGSKAKK